MKANELKKKIDAYADNFLKHAASLGPRREIVFDDNEKLNIRRKLRRNGKRATNAAIEAEAKRIEKQNLLGAIRCLFVENNLDIVDEINNFDNLAGYIEKTYGNRAEKVVAIWYAY